MCGEFLHESQERTRSIKNFETTKLSNVGDTYEHAEDAQGSDPPPNELYFMTAMILNVRVMSDTSCHCENQASETTTRGGGDRR